MTNQPQLHSSIVAMISLASAIASRHPDMGLCQLERLRNAGIPEHQIETVIEIARHIRDEASDKVDFASDKVDFAFDAESASCACTPTLSGQSCC